MLNLLDMGLDPSLVSLIPLEYKAYFFEESQIILEKLKARKEIDWSNLLRMVHTSTQNHDPDSKKKPKAFFGIDIWKEWIAERARLIKKLSKPLTLFDKRKLQREGFAAFMKKNIVITKETFRGQTFITKKEV